ncbi:hypothetical protein NY751_22260, partial [Xanthomonas campestris]|uniref:hypothetical protein n=1 Tax=Xanthomonas campestris TaxID=339 RepID=UPI0023590A07
AIEPVDEAKAVDADYGERAPVTRGIPKESSRNGKKSEDPNATLRNDATFRTLKSHCSDLL